jgi:flagellar biosynthesis/type III secretory pathway chaperone
MSSLNAPYESTERLADLVRKKRQVLTQLRDLGLREAALVDDGDTNSLLQLATAKQHLVTALQMVERQLHPYRDEDAEQRVWRNAEDRQACATLADECRDLLAEVIALEKNHEHAMLRRRDRLAAQLRDSNTARQAAGAYRQYRTDPASRSNLAPTRPPVPTTTGQLDITTDRS